MSSEVLLRVYPDLLLTWREHSLLATDRTGAIDADGLQGLFEHDARLLSRWQLLVHGRAPRLVANSAVEPHATLAYYVAPLDGEADPGTDALGLPWEEHDRELVLQVRRFVGRGMHEHVELAGNVAELDVGAFERLHTEPAPWPVGTLGWFGRRCVSKLPNLSVG
jgi:hypothetical protein